MGDIIAARLRQMVPDSRDHDARWAAFVWLRPDVGERVLAYCRGERAKGETRIGIKRCWEELRGTVGAGVTLNNSWTAPAARWVVARDPSLAGYIEMRERKRGAR